MPAPGSPLVAALCRAAIKRAVMANVDESGTTPVLETAMLATALNLPSAESVLRAYAVRTEQGSAPLLETCMHRFLAVKLAEGCRPPTIYNYRCSVRMFCDRFGRRHPAGVTAIEVSAFLNQWKSPTTRGIHWLRLREFFRWMIAIRYVSANPVSASMAHPIPLGDRCTFLTTAEATKILCRTLHTNQIGYWIMALFSGLRTKEIERLSQSANPWSWFNLENRTIQVPAWAAKVRHRYSPMHPILPLWLEWIRKHNRPFWPRNARRLLLKERRTVVAARLNVDYSEVPTRYNRLGFSNMARRAFITYSLALAGASYTEVGKKAGNSERVIRHYYRRYATPKDAEAYFGLRPEKITALCGD